MYNISEQIDTWQKKLLYYKQKESRLRDRISICEGLREDVDEMLVGDPRIDIFYRHLANLYTQLATLPANISRCRDNISTLKCELQWN